MNAENVFLLQRIFVKFLCCPEHRQLNSVWNFACPKQTVCSGHPWCCRVFSCGSAVHTHQQKFWNFARYVTVFNNQVLSRHSQQLQTIAAARCGIFLSSLSLFPQNDNSVLYGLFHTERRNAVKLILLPRQNRTCWRQKYDTLLGWQAQHGVKPH